MCHLAWGISGDLVFPCTPGCTLTKPLDCIKVCLSPRRRPWMTLFWWCTPSSPKVKVKHSCDCISTPDLELGGYPDCAQPAHSSGVGGWSPSTMIATCTGNYLIPTSHNSHRQTAGPERQRMSQCRRRGAELSSTAQPLGTPAGAGTCRPQPEDFIVMAPGLFPSVADSSWGGWCSPRQCSICCLG